MRDWVVIPLLAALIFSAGSVLYSIVDAPKHIYASAGFWFIMWQCYKTSRFIVSGTPGRKAKKNTNENQTTGCLL